MVYYNFFQRKLIIDRSDCFLASMIAAIWLTNYMKNYLSEKQKMERLKQDLICKSKLIEPDFEAISPSSSSTRIKKVINFALRGGDEEVLYRNAERIQTAIVSLLSIIETKIKSSQTLNVFLVLARSYLHFIL